MSDNQSNTIATLTVPFNSSLEDKSPNLFNITYNSNNTISILFITLFIICIIVTLFIGILYQSIQVHYRVHRNNRFDLISIDSGYFENFDEDD
ncbi:hypothetical protein PGAL8A_00191600 [Plasmodium gallinaceum]|uniref:Uncharacterized protein n=1 Tax=Plasmodium gallinaceum TaxID=5849 RepID=A0A1J1GPT4_PLAGA|nr:hypothetical protein PGAL8A_00191600 [Plasmodium gallinaceum]CRG94518.1 hypothetical protein PGAL8A_00191600 [Plasmodium gallinaceum]